MSTSTNKAIVVVMFMHDLKACIVRKTKKEQMLKNVQINKKQVHVLF